MSRANRILLCRPQGGLNDILNQIEHCCSYAERYGRHVIIDTEFRNARAFKSAIGNYFVSRQTDLALRNALGDEQLDAMDVQPSALRGRVSSYLFHYDPVSKRFVDDDTGTPLSFDFSKDHDEELLVHHQNGGGQSSLFSLLRMRLHDSLADALGDRLSRLPAGYHAVHVRGTDLKSDYGECLQFLERSKLRDLFLATDNASILAEFRSTLPNTTVHSFSSLPDNNGRPIHVNPPLGSADTRNRDAILDLLTLAAAGQFISLKMNAQSSKAASGFSRLAEALHAHRPVLARFIERPDILAMI